MVKLGSYGLFNRLNLLKNIDKPFDKLNMINSINKKNNLITPENASKLIPVFISSGISLLLIIFL